MSDASNDVLVVGAPFAIGEALVAALRAAFADQQVVVLDNPKRSSDLETGDRLVIYEDIVDRFAKQAGAIQTRVFAFNVGAINRTTAARRGAHTDYRAAKQAVRQALKELRSVVVATMSLREGDVAFRVENIDVGGGLVLGSFTIEYRDPT